MTAVRERCLQSRQMFAPDELHIRELLKALLDAHVAEGAAMQVTLPGGAVGGLRKWLSAYAAASTKKEKTTLDLPSSDLESAIYQCMVRDHRPPCFAPASLSLYHFIRPLSSLTISQRLHNQPLAAHPHNQPLAAHLRNRTLAAHSHNQLRTLCVLRAVHGALASRRTM